jgi:hypothetical protein
LQPEAESFFIDSADGERCHAFRKHAQYCCMPSKQNLPETRDSLLIDDLKKQLLNFVVPRYRYRSR